tara:strand:- start:1081 stop:1887 length:807 start_codon:yes stop_codon:yes gene_type:complete
MSSEEEKYQKCMKLTLALSRDVREFCLPMLDKLQVIGFTKLSLYRDGRRRFLSTCPDWTEYFYNEDLFKMSEYETYSRLKTYNLWAHWPTEDHYAVPFLKTAKERFNFGNGLVIIKNYGEYLDSYTFRASFEDSDANNRYMAEFNSIDRFIHHFNLVDQQFFCKGFDCTFLRESTKKPALTFDSDKRLYFQRGEDLNLLTARETECIKHLVLGNSAKEIALNLDISHRTVETYLSSIKSKLDCHSKSQIVKKIMNIDYNKRVLFQDLL